MKVTAKRMGMVFVALGPCDSSDPGGSDPIRSSCIMVELARRTLGVCFVAWWEEGSKSECGGGVWKQESMKERKRDSVPGDGSEM